MLLDIADNLLVLALCLCPGWSGVEEVTAAPGAVTEVARYDLNGRKVSTEANSSLFTIHSSLKKGLNIIRMSDGTVKKVMVK